MTSQLRYSMATTCFQSFLFFYLVLSFVSTCFIHTVSYYVLVMWGAKPDGCFQKGEGGDISAPWTLTDVNITIGFIVIVISTLPAIIYHFLSLWTSLPKIWWPDDKHFPQECNKWLNQLNPFCTLSETHIRIEIHIMINYCTIKAKYNYYINDQLMSLNMHFICHSFSNKQRLLKDIHLPCITYQISKNIYRLTAVCR